MKTLRKLTVAFVVFVACILLAEGGNRLRLRLDGEPYDGAQLRADLLARIDTLGTFTPAGAEEPAAPNAPNAQGPGPPAGGKLKHVVMHPYTGLENNHDTGAVLAHFREGTPEDEFSVVVMGGSVAG
jgi:hypothetical protein